MTRRMVGMILGVVILVMIPLTAHANDFTISVKPVIPSNQQGDVKGYFNVQMKESEKKEYEIQVTNKGDKDKVVDVTALNAGTATDGKIDYTNVKPKLSEEIPNRFTDLVTVPKKLKVPAKGVESLKFWVEMPKKAQPGIILGSIFILDTGDSEANQADKSGMSIHNQMGYPVQMMVSMTNEQVKAELVLDKVELGTHSGHPSLEIPLENTKPNIIPDITVTTEISKKGSKQVLVTDKKSNNTLAPYSIFPHRVQLTDKKVKSGTYLAHIIAESEFGKWEWNQEFKITAQVAQELNEGAVQKKLPSWLYWLIAVGILVLLIIGYLIYKVKKLSQATKIADEK